MQDYKKEQRLKELAPAVKNLEQLAGQFSDDPERVLPETGTLESAKSYWEKNAKPFLEKIVKVLCSVYVAYLDLKRKYIQLNTDYNRVCESIMQLSGRLQEVKQKNKSLRGIAAKYERVKRAFGTREVEAAAETVRQQDQAEKVRKRPRRSVSRDERWKQVDFSFTLWYYFYEKL